MKRLVMLMALVLVAGTLVAGEGKSCNRKAAKTVELTGTIQCRDGASGDDCARVFLVANAGKQYSICDKTATKLTAISGERIRVTGKLVACDEGEELVIEKVAKI